MDDATHDMQAEDPGTPEQQQRAGSQPAASDQGPNRRRG